jgi:hypothetical protein
VIVLEREADLGGEDLEREERAIEEMDDDIDEVTRDDQLSSVTKLFIIKNEVIHLPLNFSIVDFPSKSRFLIDITLMFPSFTFKCSTFDSS